MTKSPKQRGPAVRPPAKESNHLAGPGRLMPSRVSAHLDSEEESADEASEPQRDLKTMAGSSEVAPPPVNRVLSSPGAPLPSSVKASLGPTSAQSAPARNVPTGMPLPVGPRDDRFERHAESVARTGAAPAVNLDQVRIHTGPEANAAARSVNVAAFTVGSNIVFAQNQYAPETSAGRQTMAHELTHVAQQATAGLSVQRVGFFESIARFFGGGTFSPLELQAYIEGLRGTGHIENNNDSDNKARAVVAGNLHRAENVAIRALLIQEMLSGYLAGDDQTSILKILDDATADDRERIVRQSNLTTQASRFDGDNHLRLNILLGGVARHRSDPVDTNWFIAHTVTGAEEIPRNRLAVVVDQLDAQPTGEAQARRVAGPVASSNLTGSPVPLASSFSHPRGNGRGYVALHVAPIGANGQPDLSPSSQTRSYNAPYEGISPDLRSVTAVAQIRLARQETGTTAHTAATQTATGVANQTGTSNTATQQSTTGNRASATRSQSQSAERSQGVENQQSQGSEATRSNTTETTVTLSGTVTAGSNVTISGSGELQTDGRLLGLLLGLAGPEGLALYEVLNALGLLESTKFKVTATGSVGFSLQVQLSATASRRYSETRSATQRQGATQTQRAGSSGRADQGQSATAETSTSQSTTDSQQRNQSSTSTNTDTTSQSDTSTSRVFAPVIEQVGLDFRVGP